MKFRDWLEDWGLSCLKLNIGFLNAEFKPNDPDREAAWELYIELLTRVSTQYLPPESGDEKAALDSIHTIFPMTREILRKHGSGCAQFAKLAIPVLNQIVRPFTSKWHRLALCGGFKDLEKCGDFRRELADVQALLQLYTRALSSMANVEDLTQLEANEPEKG